MRKLLALLLLLLLSYTAEAEGYQLVTVDGVEYEYNQQITTILFAGVDSQGALTTTDRYSIAPRADTINLVLLDGYHNTIRILAISRDTMTTIRRYTMDGTYRDNYVSHLGYAYTYGNGGKISCENLLQAVSDMLGGIPIHEYVVTNKSGVVRGNTLVGGVTVTVPNDDLIQLYPDLGTGAVVTLDEETVADYILYRDTAVPFSNNGRMERQKTYFTAFVSALKQQIAQNPEQVWNQIDENRDYLQTSITRSQYLTLAEKIHEAAFDGENYVFLGGFDLAGSEFDELYLNQEEILPIILELFYLER